jgi:hypothetical protein
MNMQSTEVQQRLIFIDRTICHAARACYFDTSVSKELRDFVYQLGVQSTQVRQALHSDDVAGVRQSVENLAQLSDRAQNAIHPADDVNYDVKSAVILAYIEVSALKFQLD